MLRVENPDYEDDWFFSSGLEYQWLPSLLVRTGVAYELSLVNSDENRSLRVPDNNRLWLSIGTSYRVSETVSLEFGYSHIFVEDGGIVGHADDPTFRAGTQAHVDIFAGAVKLTLQ